MSANGSGDNFVRLLNGLKADMVHKRRAGGRGADGRQFDFDYVEWHQVADRLDEICPRWQYAVTMPQIVGGFAVVKATITIDGVSREGIGTGKADSETGIKKAESDALKRAARMFGVARFLYSDDEEDATASRPQAFQPQGHNSRPQVAPQSGSASGGLRAASAEDQATPKQLAFLQQLCAQKGADGDQLALELGGCYLGELSRKGASAVIDYLRQQP